MNKTLFKAILISLATFLVAWGTFMLLNPLGRTGTQWFSEQNKYIEEIASLTDDIDTITTLYISGSISESDFLTHVEVFEKQLYILKASYNDDLNRAPLKNGTHNYLTKIGCESVQNSYAIIEDVLQMLKNDSADKNQLSYKYIAYKQKVAEETAAYILAYYYVFGISYSDTEETNE